MKLRDVAMIVAHHNTREIDIPRSGTDISVDVVSVGRLFHRPHAVHSYVSEATAKCADLFGGRSNATPYLVARTLAEKIARPCAKCYPKERKTT